MTDPRDRAILASMIQWKRDILVATHPAVTGNREDTPLHMIVCAMLGASRTEWPMLSITGAKVDVHGWLYAPVQLEKGGEWRIGRIGQVEAARDALRRVADFCKLGDVDRALMMESFRRWIKHDARANDPHGERVRMN